MPIPSELERDIDQIIAEGMSAVLDRVNETVRQYVEEFGYDASEIDLLEVVTSRINDWLGVNF